MIRGVLGVIREVDGEEGVEESLGGGLGGVRWDAMLGLVMVS
jgi:hypothetical protein